MKIRRLIYCLFRYCVLNEENWKINMKDKHRRTTTVATMYLFKKKKKKKTLNVSLFNMFVRALGHHTCELLVCICAWVCISVYTYTRMCINIYVKDRAMGVRVNKMCGEKRYMVLVYIKSITDTGNWGGLYRAAPIYDAILPPILNADTQQCFSIYFPTKHSIFPPVFKIL